MFDVGLIAGDVLAVAGVVFLVVGSSSKKTSAVQLRFGAGSVMLAGRF